MENSTKIREALSLGDYMAALKAWNEGAYAALLTSGIPRGLRAGLIRHALAGVPVGGFLTAFLENDLREAVLRADGESAQKLRQIAQFLYTYFPRDCWGSPAKLKAWRIRGGVIGNDEREAAE